MAAVNYCQCGNAATKNAATKEEYKFPPYHGDFTKCPNSLSSPVQKNDSTRFSISCVIQLTHSIPGGDGLSSILPNTEPILAIRSDSRRYEPGRNSDTAG